MQSVFHFFRSPKPKITSQKLSLILSFLAEVSSTAQLMVKSDFLQRPQLLLSRGLILLQWPPQSSELAPDMNILRARVHLYFGHQGRKKIGHSSYARLNLLWGTKDHLVCNVEWIYRSHRGRKIMIFYDIVVQSGFGDTCIVSQGCPMTEITWNLCIQNKLSRSSPYSVEHSRYPHGNLISSASDTSFKRGWPSLYLYWLWKK